MQEKKLRQKLQQLQIHREQQRSGGNSPVSGSVTPDPTKSPCDKGAASPNVVVNAHDGLKTPEGLRSPEGGLRTPVSGWWSGCSTPTGMRSRSGSITGGEMRPRSSSVRSYKELKQVEKSRSEIVPDDKTAYRAFRKKKEMAKKQMNTTACALR